MEFGTRSNPTRVLSLCQERPRCVLLLLGCSVGTQMPQEQQEGGLTQLPMGQPGTLPACWAVRLSFQLCFSGLTMAMGRGPHHWNSGCSSQAPPTTAPELLTEEAQLLSRSSLLLEGGRQTSCDHIPSPHPGDKMGAAGQELSLSLL